MSAWFAVLLLASPWSITEGPDSLPPPKPHVRTVLPIRHSYELGVAALLTATTTPKPKNPRASAVRYGWENLGRREHWREWWSLGYERVRWEAPEPYRTVVYYDSGGRVSDVVTFSGTRLHRFGFQASGGFDRLFGSESRPVASVRGGLLTGTGQATVFTAGSAAEAPYDEMGAVLRVAGDIHLPRGASLVPAVTWVPSYLWCSVESVRGTHQQLSISLSLVMPVTVPEREEPAAAP